MFIPSLEIQTVEYNSTTAVVTCPASPPCSPSKALVLSLTLTSYSAFSSVDMATKVANLGRQLVTQQKTFWTPRFNTFVRYGMVELTPPSPAELPEAFRRAGQVVKSASTFGWRKLTVKEAWLNTCVAVEVLCWFFIGECIGKRGIIGYKV